MGSRFSSFLVVILLWEYEKVFGLILSLYNRKAIEIGIAENLNQMDCSSFSVALVASLGGFTFQGSSTGDEN